MLFCDSFSILQPTDPIPNSGFLGLSLWPVTSHPIRSSLKSLSFNSFNNINEMSNYSILAVFSFIMQCDEFFITNEAKDFEFPIDSFRECFEPSGFEHPIALSKNQGFCFVLMGKNASVLSHARCITLQQVVTARPLKAGSIYNIQPLFDLFPPLSQMSVRFPIVPPPHSKTSFFPSRSYVRPIKLKTSRKQKILWQKADKIQRWRLDLTNITDTIFIGSSIVAQNAELLKKKSITHIINCASQLVTPAKGFNTLNIPMVDGGDENILSHVWLTTNFIENAIKSGGKVLVNCIEGVSRSASVIIGYLMISQNIDYMTAFQIVRKQRRCASPHPRFMTQLMQLAEILGVSNTKTCIFSKERMIPFDVIERRNMIVAVPVYDRIPEPQRDSCNFTIDFQKSHSLSKSSSEMGGKIRLLIGSDVPLDFAQHARITVQRIATCLKIDSITEEKVQSGHNRVVFSSPLWDKVQNFVFSDADQSHVYISFEGNSITMFIGQKVGENEDLNELLKKCCETHHLPYKKTFTKNDSRDSSNNGRIRFT